MDQAEVEHIRQLLLAAIHATNDDLRNLGAKVLVSEDSAKEFTNEALREILADTQHKLKILANLT